MGSELSNICKNTYRTGAGVMPFRRPRLVEEKEDDIPPSKRRREEPTPHDSGK